MAQAEPKRLVLEPNRTLESWREELGIKKENWVFDRSHLSIEPEPWERNLSEIWFTILVPDWECRSLQATSLLFTNHLYGFTPWMLFAMAKRDRRLELAHTRTLIAAGSVITSRAGPNNGRGSVISLQTTAQGPLFDTLADSGHWIACAFPGFLIRCDAWEPL